jgi:hypothetical protein
MLPQALTKAKELILETARQLDEERVVEQAKICKTSENER